MTPKRVQVPEPAKSTAWPPEIGIVPYYSDDMTVIYQGDCRDILPLLPPADLLMTDPPYGIDYVGKTKKALKISNDGLGVTGTRLLVADMLNSINLRPGASFYICAPSGADELTFRLAIIDAGLQLRQTIIWVKDVFVMGRSDYHYRHESIFYGWKAGASHAFYGGRTQDTVWEVGRPFASKLHPTMKPLGIEDRAIWNSSLPGEIVIDPFLGSGTTLLAAKTLGRRGIGIEIEERYCQASAQRLAQQMLGLDHNFTEEQPQEMKLEDMF